MKATQRTKDIYRLHVPTPFSVGPVNVYLLKGEQLTLVDTGPKTEEAWKAFTQQLAEIGYKPTDIEQVILTHHHSDHVGLLDFLPNVPVYGHWRNDPWLRQDEAFLQKQNQFFKQLFSESGMHADFADITKQNESLARYSCRSQLSGELKEGDYIPGASGWTVIETPGHAQSHISLFHEKDGVMLAGDHIIKHISPNPILEPPYSENEERPKPLLQYRHSNQKCLEMDIATVFSGHGEEVTDVNELIMTQQHMQEQRAEKVKRMVKEGPKTAFEISKKLFPQAYKTEMVLTMSEAIGQLDYLEAIGEVQAQKEGTVITYTLRH